MEMHQVRYFLAVARILNFTRAAEECHVAQPSLTRAIKQLEEELGGELFRRERNLTHLTEFGARMLPLLKQCFDSAASAKALAASLRSGAVAPLTIALSSAVEMMLLTPHLKELTRTLPGLELGIRRGASADVADLLKRGEAELAVAGPLSEDWARLDAWPLFTEAFYLAVSGRHPLAGRNAAAASELASERILSRSYCEMAPDLANYLKTCKLDMSATHKVASDEDLAALVEADFGVGFLPASAARPGKIEMLSIHGFGLCRTVSVYGVAGRQRSPAAAALVKMLRAADWSQYAREELRATA